MTPRTGLLLTAAAGLAFAGTGCQGLSDGRAMEHIVLADGVVSVVKPREFEASVRLRQVGGPSDRVTFRGPARRRGNFNECTIRVIPVQLADMNGSTLGEVVGRAARERFAALQTTAGIHDVSFSSPATGPVDDPFVVNWSFSIDYTLRSTEHLWGIPTQNGGEVITQVCQTAGSPEELTAILDATRPAFSTGRSLVRSDPPED